MLRLLLLTVDPQTLSSMPPEWKSDVQVDLTPVEGVVYDNVFVYERVDSPVTVKVKGKTVFIPGEPQTIKGFGTPFINQFDFLMSFRKDLNHPRYYPGQIPCLTLWRVGLDETLERDNKPRTIRSVEEILSTPISKSRFMSMIVSNKPGTPLQRARLKLAKTLSENCPGLVDIYGRGIRDIKDKAEALDPYLFSIAIENSYIPNYITEKLTDCFVTGTVPLYSGCPNADIYYNGFIKIDPWDVQGTIGRIIEISKDPVKYYNEYSSALVCARHDLIYKHSVLPRIIDFAKKDHIVNIREISLIPDEVGYYW
jgi:hypothetical protein